ncbi:MAG: cytochrome c-type biogenesis protein [Martelella sp.]|uniref:cytochrome c-type biogenesis protein n=1 Tax=Martelella sp. TaxID=1969699 RepID=UPI003242974D
MIRLVVLVFAVLLPIGAAAVEPDEMLSDPALEARAREISAELRCMVCQNQSIDDSNADLARDLRLLVRDRLAEGDSDDEVIDYVVSRYGEFVLLKPRFSPHTWLLWGAPALLILLGAIGLWRLAAARRGADRPLSRDEELRLEKILSETDDH